MTDAPFRLFDVNRSREGFDEYVKLVRDFSRYIQDIVQRNIDDMLPKRKSFFWGKVLDGTAPPAPRFEFRTS